MTRGRMYHVPWIKTNKALIVFSPGAIHMKFLEMCQKQEQISGNSILLRSLLRVNNLALVLT
eukprot:scaffold3241_cov107-Skeletonema_menzelii.AAC.2